MTRKHTPIGSDVELLQLIDAEAGGGGGGSSAAVGALISNGDGGFSHTFSGAASVQITFDTVEFDSSAIADLPNSQLKIPVGLAGIWAYGYTFAFIGGNPAAASYVRALGSVIGAAWNLQSGMPVDPAANGPAVGLSAHSVAHFAEGDTISGRLLSDAGTWESGGFDSDPALLYAYYLGTS